MGYIVLCGTDKYERKFLFRAESARYSEQNARCSEYGLKKKNVITPYNLKCLLFEISLGDRKKKRGKIVDISTHTHIYIYKRR